jgi:hypothetical protein
MANRVQRRKLEVICITLQCSTHACTSTQPTATTPPSPKTTTPKKKRGGGGGGGGGGGERPLILPPCTHSPTHSPTQFGKSVKAWPYSKHMRFCGGPHNNLKHTHVHGRPTPQQLHQWEQRSCCKKTVCSLARWGCHYC